MGNCYVFYVIYNVIRLYLYKNVSMSEHLMIFYCMHIHLLLTHVHDARAMFHISNYNVNRADFRYYYTYILF